MSSIANNVMGGSNSSSNRAQVVNTYVSQPDFRDWMAQRIITGLKNLKLTPKIPYTDPVTGKTVIVNAAPKIRQFWHEVTPGYNVVIYELDPLIHLMAIQPEYSDSQIQKVERYLSSLLLGLPVRVFQNPRTRQVGIGVALSGNAQTFLSIEERRAPDLASPLTQTGTGDGQQTAKQAASSNSNLSQPEKVQAQAPYTSGGRGASTVQEEEDKLPKLAPFHKYVNLDTYNLNNRPESSIPRFCLGIGADGPVYLSLSQTVHILGAGSSGSGKSMLLETLAIQLLMGDVLGTKPGLIKLALVDQGLLTFNPVLYNGLPQLVAGKVLTEEVEVENLLGSLKGERERRRYRFSSVPGAPNDLESYNRAVGSQYRFPTIVVIMEEFSLLSSAMRKRLNEPLLDLLLDTRKYGIFFIAVGQEFRRNIVDVSVRNNFQTRLAIGDVGEFTLEKVLEIDKKEGKVSQVAPGRGVIKLGGRVSEFQGLKLGRDDLITMLNLVREKAGLPPLEHGQEDLSDSWKSVGEDNQFQFTRSKPSNSNINNIATGNNPAAATTANPSLSTLSTSSGGGGSSNGVASGQPQLQQAQTEDSSTDTLSPFGGPAPTPGELRRVGVGVAASSQQATIFSNSNNTVAAVAVADNNNKLKNGPKVAVAGNDNILTSILLDNGKEGWATFGAAPTPLSTETRTANSRSNSSISNASDAQVFADGWKMVAEAYECDPKANAKPSIREVKKAVGWGEDGSINYSRAYNAYKQAIAQKLIIVITTAALDGSNSHNNNTSTTLHSMSGSSTGSASSVMPAS